MVRRFRRSRPRLPGRRLMAGGWRWPALGLAIAAIAMLSLADPVRACAQVEQFSGAMEPSDRGHRQLLDRETLTQELLPAIAQQLGTTAGQLRVIDTRAIVWSSGCLGVSEPDRLCTQALVDGIAIAVVYGGQPHHFHATEDRRLWPVSPIADAPNRVCRLDDPRPATVRATAGAGTMDP